MSTPDAPPEAPVPTEPVPDEPIPDEPSLRTRFTQVVVPMVAVVAVALAAIAVVNLRSSGSSSSSTASPTTVTVDPADPYIRPTVDPNNVGTVAGSDHAGMASGTASTTPTNMAGLEEAIAAGLGVTTTLHPPSTTTTVAWVAGPDALGAALARHRHDPAPPPQPVDVATQVALGKQIDVARSIAEAFPTVADALKAGYVQAGQAETGVGVPFVKWSLLTNDFVVDRPAVLLFTGSTPTAPLAGLAYLVLSDTEPVGFPGPGDHWQQLIGACLKDGAMIGDESITPAACSAAGGAKAIGPTVWLLHAWVVAGFENPDGVFAPNAAGLQ